MPKKPSTSRVPAAVGAIPVVGDLVRSADSQARWMQDLLEQNARLVGQLPATIKSFNDALERFNQTVGRLDAAVTRIEGASRTLTGPLEKAVGVLDPTTLREIPETLETLRRETVPALRAAVDTQRQVAVLQNTIDRIVTMVAELPGAGMLRRRSAGRDGAGRDGGGRDGGGRDGAGRDGAGRDGGSRDGAGRDGAADRPKPGDAT